MKMLPAAKLALQMGVRVRTARKAYQYGNMNCNCNKPILKGQKYATYGKPSQGWEAGWRMHYCCFALPACEHWQNPIAPRAKIIDAEPSEKP